MLQAVILFFYNHRFSNNNRLSHSNLSELLRTSHGTQSHSFTPPISAPIYHRPPCRTPPHPIYYTAPPHIPYHRPPYTIPPHRIQYTTAPYFSPHRPPAKNAFYYLLATNATNGFNNCL